MNDYETDVLAWSERQAELLRRRAANEIDWDNIAEEIESVGLSELRACRSHLFQALLHDLKTLAWPESREVSHWRSEFMVSRHNAGLAFAPSMRQRIDLPRIYAQAIQALPETIDGVAPLAVPVDCRFTLDDLVFDAPA